jgi:hypothetical protein
MKLALFNIFNLVSCGLYVIVNFGFYVVQIYGSGLERHGQRKRALGSDWANVSTFWADTT